MQNSTDFFHYTFVQIVLTLAVVIVVQIILRESIYRIVAGMVRGHKHASRQEELQREKTLAGVFKAALAVTLWTIAVVVILYQLHINVAALLTGAGLVGVLVGFGAQNAIKDYLAGVFVLAENQYRIGDIVTLYAGGANIGGVVEEITLRITKLRDADGNLHTVPNGSGGVVTNRSFNFANVNIDVGVAYDSDLDKVRAVIDEVGIAQAGDEDLKSVILEPIHFLRLDAFGDRAVMLRATGKVQPAKQWEVAGDFRMRLKKAFDANHITIPLPQVVVHQAKK